MSTNVKEPKQKRGFFELCFKEFKFGAIATIGYILICCLISYILGYSKSGKEMTYIAGIPTWAIFGVILPWIAMVILTAVYALKYMKGDEK